MSKHRRINQKEKRISFLMLFCIICLLLYRGLPNYVYAPQEVGQSESYYATSKNANKVISLVYDDSASMSDEGAQQWAYANYAFQVFIGLLNENDRLYVTYMSSPKYSNLLLAPNYDRQNVLTDVRNHYKNSSTPVAAVNRAYQRLDEYTEGDAETEYWLVVLTDGYLQSSATGDVLSSEYINDMFQEYAGKMMNNGSNLHIVYLGMGEDIATIEAKNPDYQMVKYAKREDEIITDMSDIAQYIADWDDESLDGVQYQFISDNTIRVETDYPLEKIAILSQKTTSMVTEVNRIDTGEEERKTPVNISQNLSITYPEYPGCSTNTELVGSVAFVTDENSYLEAGTYEITFDESINKDEVDVLFDVAVETRLFIKEHNTNEYVQPGDSINDRKKYDFLTDAVVTHTNTKIEEYMESSTDELHEKIKITNETDDLDEVDTNVLENRSYLSGVIQIQANSTLGEISSGLNAQLRVDHENTYTTKIEGSKATISRKNIIDREVELQLKVYCDEVQMTKQELEKMRLQIKTSGRFLKLDTKIDTDGTITIKPYFGKANKLFRIFAGWLPTWLIKAQSYDLALTLKNMNKEQLFICENAFTIKREALPINILFHLEPFLIVIILTGYTDKARFAKHLSISYIPLKSDKEILKGMYYDWHHIKLSYYLFGNIPLPYSIRAWIPYISDRRIYKHLILTADNDQSNRKIIIETKRKDYVIQYLILREDTISRHKSVYIHKDSERLYEIKTNHLEIDENLGIIVFNSVTGNYTLFMITYDRKDNDRKDKQ